MTRARLFLGTMTAVALALAGCTSWNRMSEEEQTATAATVGAVAGAAAGAQVAGDGNRTLGAILGGLLGAGGGAVVADNY